MKYGLILTAVLVSGILASFIIAETPPASSPASAPTSTPASKLSPKEAADLKKAEAKKAAEEYMALITPLYMGDKWDDLAKELKNAPKFVPGMTPDMTRNLQYIQTSYALHRPTWWAGCRATSNCSFPVGIWGKAFTANYVHSDEVGLSGSVYNNGVITTYVTWSPIKVDNPRDMDEPWAKRLKITESEFSEACIWHELGHCYITNFLPTAHVLKLWEDYNALFHACQEFYADMTALYHAGPRGHLALIQTRAYYLNFYTETEQHDRAAYGLGTLFLMNVMADPSKWPSIHFPPKLPEKNPELNILVYAYTFIEPTWTLDEDRMFREMVKTFIMSKGEAVLRTRGTIELPNKLQFKLMAADDRECASARLAWWKENYPKLISSGRVDKEDKMEKEKGRELTEEEMRALLKNVRVIKGGATTKKSGN